jgi:hypothetical protein
MKAILASGTLALILAGCATPELRTGASSDEAKAALGEPAAVVTRPGGGTIWEYPRGPLGLQTYLAEFDDRGKFVSYKQVLTDDNVQKIGVGMGQEQVRALIGPPWRKDAIKRKDELVWDYLYRDTWGYRVEFSVMFDSKGAVVSKASRRLDDQKDNRQ